MKNIDEKTQVVSIDDQKSFLQSFMLAAKMIRIKDYAMYQLSDDVLDAIPPEPSNLRIMFVDWNLVGSAVQKGELIRELKNRVSSDVLIYVLSTSMDSLEHKEAEEAGANGWLSKQSLIATLKTFNKEYESKIGEFYVWQ